MEKILLKVQDKGGLYFGLFPKFEWIEHIRQKIWENIEYPIGKGLRDQVWNEYIGIKNGISNCYCCNIQPISQQNFEVGHIIAKKKGGSNNIINLRPICSKCNKSMGTKPMFEYMTTNQLMIETSNKLKELFQLNKELFYKKAL